MKNLLFCIIAIALAVFFVPKTVFAQTLPGTASYRVSETFFDRNDTTIPWSPYTSEGNIEPVNITHDFASAKVGDTVTLFVQFKSAAVTQDVSDVSWRTIKIVVGNPSLKGISCQFNPTGVGTLVSITGLNFGDQGNASVKIAGQDADITSWAIIPPEISPSPTGDPTVMSTLGPTSAVTVTPTVTIIETPTPTCTARPACLDDNPPCEIPEPGGGWCSIAATPTPISESPTPIEEPTPTDSGGRTLGVSAVPYRVGAKIGSKIDGKTLIQLTLDDGTVLQGSCQIGLTTIDFTARRQCGPVDGNLTLDNVKTEVIEGVDKARPVFNSSVKFDKEGMLSWTAPNLEVGKSYNLIMKGPKTLGVRKGFMAEEGTTILDDIILPVGDIFPLTVPDNVVNSMDNSELIREWAPMSDVTRAGDFNLDNRVNSVDYACMRINIGQIGEKFVK